MKKSDFIRKVLKHPENTVFTDPAQVEAVMLVFKSLGVDFSTRGLKSGRTFVLTARNLSDNSKPGGVLG